MESTEELMKRFQKRDMGGGRVVHPEPGPDQVSNEARFVQIRRKSFSSADSSEIDQEVSLEALVDKNGLVGLGG